MLLNVHKLEYFIYAPLNVLELMEMILNVLENISLYKFVNIFLLIYPNYFTIVAAGKNAANNPIINLKDTFFEPAVGSRPHFNRM